jgi:thiamine pyrophosphokinase
MNFTKHVLTGVIDGAYGDRELTAEEQEEEDISATKNEIKFMKQQDVSSTRNALRLAQQAEESGRDTLQRLGAQGERIHNTERNLDMASSQVCSTRPPHIGLEC